MHTPAASGSAGGGGGTMQGLGSGWAKGLAPQYIRSDANALVCGFRSPAGLGRVVLRVSLSSNPWAGSAWHVRSGTWDAPSPLAPAQPGGRGGTRPTGPLCDVQCCRGKRPSARQRSGCGCSSGGGGSRSSRATTTTTARPRKCEEAQQGRCTHPPLLPLPRPAAAACNNQCHRTGQPPPAGMSALGGIGMGMVGRGQGARGGSSTVLTCHT